MKRIIIAVFAVLVLAFANPAATSADKPDNPGQSQVNKEKNDKDKDSCKKKSCGQPHGQSCKHPNVHKTWCKNGRDDDDDNGHHKHHDDNDNDNGGRLANTGA